MFIPPKNVTVKKFGLQQAYFKSFKSKNLFFAIFLVVRKLRSFSYRNVQICDAFRNLVSFVRFKIREKHLQVFAGFN